MPKQVFWPLAIVVLALIFLASNLRLLPVEFTNLWPLIFITVGLGGLVTSDRTEWLTGQKTKSSSKSMPAKSVKSRRRK